jgi:hypothetical protein
VIHRRGGGQPVLVVDADKSIGRSVLIAADHFVSEAGGSGQQQSRTQNRPQPLTHPLTPVGWYPSDCQTYPVKHYARQKRASEGKSVDFLSDPIPVWPCPEISKHFPERWFVTHADGFTAPRRRPTNLKSS